MLDLRGAIERFMDAKMLVIGDIMLDRYTFGDVDRVSPEAPVPVVVKTSEKSTPGGAGNVANNLVALGAAVMLAGMEDSLITEISTHHEDSDSYRIEESKKMDDTA
jgi:bifunctional ADP-heptose synthase (sugar kinase/adenylyltransferase)